MATPMVLAEAVHKCYGRLEVLRGIDLSVAAGQTVALVGHTGAGKSTLVKLLARFYDPTSGSIRIDGHDLRDVQVRSLRHQLGIVPQEGFLFAASIRDNIEHLGTERALGLFGHV